MAEKKNVAIFELAPELGLKPLELVKQLKESGLKLGIKSHMDEVSEDDAEKIKSYFLSKKLPPKQAEKKSVVKKKAAEPTLESFRVKRAREISANVSGEDWEN